MNVHKNARLTAHSRAELVRRVRAGQLPKAVATAFGVDVKTVGKWVKRFEAKAGRSGGSLVAPPQASSADVGRDRGSGYRPSPPAFCGRQIAKETGISPATVSRILRLKALAGRRIWTRPRRSSATSAPIPAS